MSGLRTLFEKRSDEAMAGLVTDNYPFYGGSKTGISVTPLSAERSSAVFACIRILSEIPAMLPLNLYKNTKNGKEIAREHPLHNVLHNRANEELSSFDLIVALFGDAARGGNGYSLIDYDRNGDITALWRINPDSVSIWRETGSYKLWYVLQLPDRIGGGYTRLPKDRIFHYRMFTKDGLVGRSTTRMFAESIGLTLATEQYAAAYFGNGAAPGIVLQHPGSLSDDAYKHIKESWNEMHQGIDNAHKPAILEEGMTIDKASIPNNEAQFLETRKFQVNDIARIFRIPPHMIGDLEQSTNNNIEHQGLEFTNMSLMPWLVNFEKAVHNQLLTPAEQKIYFAKFVVAALVRGDLLSRYQAYAQGRQNSWLTINDIRESEDMNLVDGGDDLLAPLNMIPISMMGSQPTKNGKNSRDLSPVIGIQNPLIQQQKMDIDAQNQAIQSRKQLLESFSSIFEDAAKRLIKRESQDVIAMAKRLIKNGRTSEFETELSTFYEADFRDAVTKIMMPVIQGFSNQVRSLVCSEINHVGEMNAIEDLQKRFFESVANSLSVTGKTAVLELIKTSEANNLDQYSELETLMTSWNDNRSSEVAHKVSNLMANRTALWVYEAAGIRFVRWMDAANNKPVSEEILKRENAFQNEGDEFNNLLFAA